MSRTFQSLIDDREDWDGLLVVDSLALAMRYKDKAQPFRAEFLTTINSLCKSYGCNKVVVVGDYKGSKFRKDIDPEYKANRKERYKDQTPEEKAAFLDFFKNYEDALEFVSETFPVIRLEGVEADDIAAYIVKQCKDDFGDIWLISVDKDWDLLLDENVHRFSTMTRREYKLCNFYEYHDCDTPEQYVSMKTIMGDAGDNIIGVPGLGPKRSYNLIREYGSALDIYCNLPLEGKQKFIQAINNSGDTLVKNSKLVDLLTYCEEAINCHPNGIEITNNVIEGLLK